MKTCANCYKYMRLESDCMECPAGKGYKKVKAIKTPDTTTIGPGGRKVSRGTFFNSVLAFIIIAVEIMFICAIQQIMLELIK